MAGIFIGENEGREVYERMCGFMEQWTDGKWLIKNVYSVKKNMKTKVYIVAESVLYIIGLLKDEYS